MKKNVMLLACLIGLLVGCKNKPKETAFLQWGNLQKGKYAVGYKDTVLFKQDEKFSYFDYKGNKPFFVSIWYPAIDNEPDTFMSYKSYFDYQIKPEYGKLYDSLIAIFHKNVIHDDICINIKSWDNDLKFTDSLKLMYNDINETKVNAKRNLVPKGGRLPCIFYHHGAQSNPIDDNVFCEYMASQGFIVVSSAYNLPNEAEAGGLTNGISDREDLTDLAFIVKEIKKLYNVDTTKMVAAGHSWGAQTDILFDSCELVKPFKSIISFHTTLEGFDLEFAKKHWKDLSYLWTNKCNNSTTPTFLFAPLHFFNDSLKDTKTGRFTSIKTDSIYPEFKPFRNNTTTPYKFITVIHNVTHDGFITIGNLRFPFAEKYNLPDKEEIIRQQHYYEQIILLANKIANGAITNTPLSTSDTLISKYFKIETQNK